MGRMQEAVASIQVGNLGLQAQQLQGRRTSAARPGQHAARACHGHPAHDGRFPNQNVQTWRQSRACDAWDAEPYAAATASAVAAMCWQWCESADLLVCASWGQTHGMDLHAQLPNLLCRGLVQQGDLAHVPGVVVQFLAADMALVQKAPHPAPWP